MGLKRKLEGEIEIKSAAGDVFHELFKNTPHDISNVSPHFIQGCDLHVGDYGTPGSIVIWNYTLDGKAGLKDVAELEVVDDENKLIRFKVIEGDLKKDKYKNIVVTYQVIPKDEETSTVKWIFEYEKLHAGVPEPTALLDSLLGVAKDIHDHPDPQTRRADRPPKY